MATKELKELYKGDVKIEFFPDSHRYKLSGQKSYLTSVTAVTGIIDKSRPLVLWAVGLAGSYLRQYLEKSSVNQFSAEELLPLIDEACKQHTIKKEEAASIGSTVHDWAEKFAQAKIEGKELPEIPEDAPEQVIKGITAFLDWYNTNHVVFHATEVLLYSKEHEYCGHTDLIATVNNKKVVIDYKTGKAIYDDYRFQIAAYKKAYEEESGEKLDGSIILHFGKEDGEFKTLELDNDDYKKDFDVFLACLTVKNRIKELTSKVWNQ